MKKKIYLIHPSYRDQDGVLLKGKSLYLVSLALPAVSAIIPSDWEKQCCFEYFDDIDFETDASVIGISSMGYEIFRGVEIAKEFRRRGKIVLFGGFQPHISTAFVREQCDAVIHGNPGIPAMTGILNDALAGTLKAEYFCDIDLNYSFDYSAIDTGKILFTPVLLSIGCRNMCDYCCVGAVYKGRYRLRRLTYLIEELEQLRQTTRRIAFVDTNIYNNKEHLQSLCREMIRRKYRFIWGAQTTIDIGDDPETLALMKQAGCRLLYIGMETVEQSNLDAVHKRYAVESYEQKIRTIHDSGLRIAAFFMYGLDSDTVETSKSMSRFIIDHRIALPMLNVLVPTPGTRLYEELRRDGRITMESDLDFLKNNPAYNSSFNLCFYIPKQMTAKQVEEGFIDLLRRLSGFYQVIRRSLNRDIPLTMFLLYMNWMFRKEYFILKNKRSPMVAKVPKIQVEVQHA